MKLEFAKRIVETGSNMDLELELRENYSGRGMFRSSTVGIVGNLSDIIQAIAATGVEIGEESVENNDLNPDAFIREMNLRFDNMGMSMIAY